MVLRIGKNRSIVLFRVRGGFIGYGSVNVRRLAVANQHGSHGGTGEGVMKALHGSERHAEGRAAGIEEATAGVAFHYGDANTFAFTKRIELSSVLIYATESGVEFLYAAVLKILGGRKHVKNGIDGEEQHFDEPGFDRLPGDKRVVGGETEMEDFAFHLEAMHIVHEIGVQNTIPFLLRITVVDEPNIEIVGVEAAQLILKGRYNLGEVAGTLILTVAPDGTDLPLDDSLVAIATDRVPQIAADLGICHPAVADIDAIVYASLGNGAALLAGLALQPFRTVADFGNQKSGFAQFAIFHMKPPEK